MQIVIVAMGLFLFYLFWAWTGRLVTDYKRKMMSLDDVSPKTTTPREVETFLRHHPKKHIVLFVTPFYQDHSQAPLPNRWVRGIKRLRQKYKFGIGLHGCYHDYQEFLIPRPHRILRAREEFSRAFGFYPKVFRAPGFDLNPVDLFVVKLLKMKNYGWWRAGKVYHPVDLQDRRLR